MRWAPRRRTWRPIARSAALSSTSRDLSAALGWQGCTCFGLVTAPCRPGACSDPSLSHSAATLWVNGDSPAARGNGDSADSCGPGGPWGRGPGPAGAVAGGGERAAIRRRPLLAALTSPPPPPPCCSALAGTVHAAASTPVCFIGRAGQRWQLPACRSTPAPLPSSAPLHFPPLILRTADAQPADQVRHRSAGAGHPQQPAGALGCRRVKGVGGGRWGALAAEC